ncbi:MAG TPA: amidohydrolase family protein [Bryobacteraceae bacterium]|nr:amidohydrolase family protein [Bryobacteraceae bacterium]
MPKLTRRQSLAAFAALVQSPPPVFDAHVHVWSSDTDTYPLAPGINPRSLLIPSFTAEELLKHARPAGVAKINLVQMTGYGLDHRYMLDVIRKNPETFVGTGIVPAFSEASLPSPDAAMVDLAKGGVYAFRLRGRQTRAGAGVQWLDHPGYGKMFTAAARHNLALSFLIGPNDLPKLDRMCTKHPEAPVIIDHICRIGATGGIEEKDVAALCAMARHKRLMLKIGAFYALGAKREPYTDLLPLIRRVVTAFGPDRCMWETDCPYQVQKPHTYAASVALIRDHAGFLSASDKHHILFGTANRFFNRRTA